MNDLHHLDAAEAARRIAAGRITSEQLVRACLDRIAAREGEVSAWAHCDPAAAIAQARAVDKAGAKGVLGGVPVGFKDVIDTADQPSQYNSPIYRGNAEASGFVQRNVAAGDRQRRRTAAVTLQHRSVVHAVNMV